LSPFADARTCL